jgi:small GTP-binding protein
MGFMKKVKCVVLGDPSVGKSSLILRYATDSFDVRHTLTVLDKYLMQVKVGENTILLEIIDNAGTLFNF